MKFNYSLILLIFTISWSTISSPLKDGGGNIVTPLILDFNPSLITVNEGASFRLNSTYSLDSNCIDASIGYTNRLNNSGFSILYNNYYKNTINEFLAAFGTKSLNFNFGADFKFIIINGKVDFTVDAGANYLFTNNIYAGLLINNIFNSQFINVFKPFSSNIFCGGKIPRIPNFFFDFKFGFLLFNDFSDLGYEGYLSLKKSFFENPSLLIYGSSDVIYDYNKDIATNINFALGTKIKFEKLSVNIFCGSIVNIESLNKSIYGELSFDTKRKNSNNKLICEIYVENDGSDVILTTKGIFKTDKVSLKRWTLFIYTKSLKNENIIKTFSGGNIPPSSIIWDKRDSSGKLVDKGEYYVKIVIIDDLNKTIQSNRETININYQ